MSDPCANAPSATPTDGISLIRAIISKGFRESTKRAIAVTAAAILCLCTVALTYAVVHQAIARGAVDGQLVIALLGMGAWTAALAGVAYRKPDSTGAGNA